MNTKSGVGRRVAIVLALSLGVVAPVAPMASASAAVTHHHHRHHHKGSGGGTGAPGGGTGPAAGSPQLLVSVAPNPVVEMDGDVFFVVQVEASPILEGDSIDIAANQLQNSCVGIQYESVQVGGGVTPIVDFLDDDGNATIIIEGTDCAPGDSLISVDLIGAPYLTATATLVIDPPAVTPPGLTAFPNPEVETGNSPTSGDSDVYLVFQIETSAVYAEDTVDLNATQLEERCLQAWRFEPAGGTPVVGVGVTGPTPVAILDNDGNAVVAFFGLSCAAGESTVTADLIGGAKTTYSATVTVSPPAVTI